MLSSPSTVLAALKILPDEASLTVPVPTLRAMLSERGEGNLMTVEDIARLTKRSPGAVRAWIRNGELRARQVGRRYLVGREDYEAFLQGPKLTPDAPAKPIETESMVSTSAWRSVRGREGPQMTSSRRRLSRIYPTTPKEVQQPRKGITQNAQQ